MNIDYLTWRDITITHLDKKGNVNPKIKPDVIPCGSISFGVRDGLSTVTLSLQGYESVHGFSTKKMGVYIDPELVSLSSQAIEFKATWWSVTFQYKDKKNPKKITGEIRKQHPVKITAKF